MRIPYEVQISDPLRASNLKLVLAESCTGGLAGHLVTNVPGSSDYYLGSITAYAYEAKEALLGVRHETLQRYVAVSRETVLEMAHGARHALAGGFPLDSIIGLSISGIAGPGGGLPGKPVGTVWIGLSAADGDHAWYFHFQGNRLQNKRSAARQALKLVIAYCHGTLPPKEEDEIQEK
ncbi:MAG TPA: CinA family protein [Anaerolineaceae bacterium]|nr:CinA family protein [Anaerolineaceae bacterium]